MRAGHGIRIPFHLINILLLSVVVAALDASLLVRPRLLSETDQGEDRGETYGGDALLFQLMKLRDGRGRIPRDAYARAKAHVDRLRANAAARSVESAPAPQISAAMFSAAAPASTLGPAPISPQNWRWLGPGNIGGRIRALAISRMSPSTMFAGSVGGGIWKTTNAGASWTPVDDFMASLSVSSIVFDPTNASILYAGTAEGYGNSDALRDYGGGTLYRSTNAGATFSPASTTPLLENGQGWYDAALWVNPKDANHVVVGGVNLRQTFDGGATWNWIGDRIHVDHHVIVEDPRFDDVNNRTVFIGNDGGVYRATSIRTVAQSGYTPLNNNLGVTQFYGAAGNATSGVIVGGTQDNGTLVRRPQYATSWKGTLGGDGGFVAADPTDPSSFYAETIYLQLFRSADGGATWSGIGSGIADAGQSANFIAPFALDPNNPNRMYAGGARLWVSANVKSAAPMWKAVFGSSGANHVSAIAIAPSAPDIAWIGLTYGNVYRSSNATSSAPTFASVTAPTFGNFVTHITISPFDPNVVYVTTGGFGTGNVLKTTDGGATWSDVTGGDMTGLPNVPANDLEIDPQDANTLYAATEVGVFTSHDGGSTWDVPQRGPANVAVDELFWMGTTLVAATHGRGLFSIDVNGAGTPSVSASPTSVDFGTQALNTSTASRRVAVTNTGPAALTIYSLSIAGANAR